MYSVRRAKRSVKHRRWPTYLKFILHHTLHIFSNTNFHEGWQKEKLKEFAAKKEIKWQFITPTVPHQNGCVEASCKRAIKKAIGDNKLTPFELYTCFLEIANLINQWPIGRVSTDPNEGTYLCPNDISLGRASSEIPQGPFRETRDPRKRIEFVQRIVDDFWKHWQRDVFPALVPRRK